MRGWSIQFEAFAQSGTQEGVPSSRVRSKWIMLAARNWRFVLCTNRRQLLYQSLKGLLLTLPVAAAILLTGLATGFVDGGAVAGRLESTVDVLRGEGSADYSYAERKAQFQIADRLWR